MSKILIIGNGFDLSHGLPTKYEDFLDFCILWDHMIKYKGSSRYDDAVTNLKNAKTQIDQEVLKSFIDNKRCKTTIYHHNRASMGLQIKNPEAKGILHYVERKYPPVCF